MFENLPIGDECARRLSSAVNSGKLSHAVILDGASEQTRRQTALCLAQAIVCTGENKPCGVCPACRKAKKNIHPDIHFIEKLEDKEQILIRQIREDLIEEAARYPNDGDKSVFIIFEAQLMNQEAQSALLKTLEEPLPYVSIILCCSAKSSMLETIISRAPAYYLGDDNMKENRDATSAAHNIALDLAVALGKKNESDFLILTEKLRGDKGLFRRTVLVLQAIIRDAIVYNEKNMEPMTDCEQAAKSLAENRSVGELLKMYELTKELIRLRDASANMNLLSAKFCSSMFNI